MAARAERAIDYGEPRAFESAPFQDRANFYSHHALSIAKFVTGRYEKAANAARRAIQSGPNFSISHCFLAAPLVKLGRLEEGKAAASRVLRCSPHSARRDCLRCSCAPGCIADPLREAWSEAGLPT